MPPSASCCCLLQIAQNPTSCFAYGATLSIVAAEHPDLAHLLVANVHQVGQPQAVLPASCLIHNSKESISETCAPAGQQSCSFHCQSKLISHAY